MEDKIKAVFKDTMSLDADELKEKLKYNEVEGWDSVGHMMLIAALEDAFDCMLEMDDIIDMSSYEKALEIMAKYV